MCVWIYTHRSNDMSTLQRPSINRIVNRMSPPFVVESLGSRSNHSSMWAWVYPSAGTRSSWRNIQSCTERRVSIFSMIFEYSLWHPPSCWSRDSTSQDLHSPGLIFSSRLVRVRYQLLPSLVLHFSFCTVCEVTLAIISPKRSMPKTRSVYPTNVSWRRDRSCVGASTSQNLVSILRRRHPYVQTDLFSVYLQSFLSLYRPCLA